LPRTSLQKVAWVITFWTGALSSWAQDSIVITDKAPEYRQFERVQITGSSILRKEVTQSLPVQIITRQDIQNSTAKNLEELLHVHPAMLHYSQPSNLGLTRGGYSSASLHGMPTGTLVLLNGQRLASYPRQTIITQERSGTDLSQIPLSAVDRIELLTDGASSLYGTDAIAGVVNIITQTERKQWEVTAQTRIPDHQKGIGKSLQINGGTGSLSRDGFSWVLTAEIENQDPLFGADRPYASSGRYQFTHGGRTYTTDGPQLTPVQSVPTLSSSNRTSAPFGRLWNALYQGGECPKPYVTDLTQPACLYNAYGDMSLYPRQDMARLHSQLQWNTSVGTAYAEILHSQIDQERYGTRWDTYVSRIGSKPTDPGYALAQAQGFTPGQTFLLWRPSELGALRQFYQDKYTSIRTGIKGTWAEWDYQASASWSESSGQWSRETATYPNLGRTTDAARVLTNDTLLMPLNSPTENSAQMKALLADLPIQRRLEQGVTQTQSLQLNASKVVGELNGQDVLLGWGTEWRQHKDRYTPVLTEQPAFNASRKIWAQYAELIFPVADQAEITAALRNDQYSDFGRTTNAKLAGKWLLSPQWLLRGSMGTGFRAPTLGQMTETDIFSSAFVSSAGCSNSLNQVAAQLSQTLGRQGQCVNDGNLWMSGRGSRDLKPETSSQQTWGVRFMPTANQSFSIDHWRISMRNTIRQYPASLVLANPLQNTQYFTLDPSGRLDLYLPMVNMGSSVKSGLDLAWLYRVPTDSGRIFFKFDTSHYLKSEQVTTPGSAPSSDLGQYSTASGTVTPRSVSRWSVAYQHPKGAVSTTLNRVSSYINEPFSARDEQTRQLSTITGWKTPAFWTLDLHTHYNLAPHVTVKAAIANLLNRSAPLSFTQNTSSVFGVNTNLSSVWGRTVSLSMTVRF
jgi:iron complex outermembrane receptor protein